MKKRRKNRKTIVIIGLLAVLALAGGLYYYRETQMNTVTAATPAMQTTRARQGDMLISLSGAGTLVPSSSIDVGFETSGKLIELLVQVGDRVQAGDVLARLDSEDAQIQVQQAEISLRLAELKLAELEEEADASDIAAAQASLAVAQENLAKVQAGPSEEEIAAAKATLAAAEEKYQELLAGPSQDEITTAQASLEKARLTLQEAQMDYVEAANDTEKASAAAAAYQKAVLEYEVAEINYKAALEGASESDLQSALAQVNQARKTLDDLLASPTAAELASAEAQVATAQANLDALLAGASELERETAALDVEKAKVSLREAQKALDACELKAPISGAVTAVDATVGQTVSTSPIISLADLDHVQVRFYIDETDMSLIAVGQEVEVIFDALPDDVFTGQVTRIEPGLTTMSGVPVVTAWAALDLPEGSQTKFMGEMNANVEVIAAERTGVVLVSMEAVREMAPGQYAVFVVGEDGELNLRPVQVGLSDNINYEILSGLQAGEVVSTGIVDTGS